MRVKTVPRHLPRKLATSFKSVLLDESKSCRLVSQKSHEGQSVVQPSVVKTVNFSTVGDIVEQVELGLLKQEPKASSAEEALDLSNKNCSSSAEGSDKFRDTYLYQLMTDAVCLQQARRESTRGAAKQRQQQQQSRCPYCKKEFGSESEVKAHLNVVADERTKQLRCCACGKWFAQKRYLRYHQRSHSERSKYSCDICTRKYSRLDNLTRHNIFHTNPDKFPCNSCERTFARKDLLNKHLKCHENKYKYHCDICQKYFKGPLSLDNHVRLFHAPVPNKSSASSYQVASGRR